LRGNVFQEGELVERRVKTKSENQDTFGRGKVIINTTIEANQLRGRKCKTTNKRNIGMIYLKRSEVNEDGSGKCYKLCCL